MISYERIDKSDSIDFNKSEGSKESMICHYFYFSDSFKYQPYVCNACSDFSMTVQNLSDIFVVTVKNIDYKKKNFMAPFYGWGSTASRLEPLRGGSLLFTTIGSTLLMLTKKLQFIC